MKSVAITGIRRDWEGVGAAWFAMFVGSCISGSMSHHGNNVAAVYTLVGFILASLHILLAFNFPIFPQNRGKRWYHSIALWVGIVADVTVLAGGLMVVKAMFASLKHRDFGTFFNGTMTMGVGIVILMIFLILLRREERRP